MTEDAVGSGRKRAGRRGRSTLLQLILAVGLFALLAGIVLPEVSRTRRIGEGNDSAARMDRLERAIRAYAEDILALPPYLEALLAPPPGVSGWGGPYLANDFDQAPPGVPSSCTVDEYGDAFEYTVLSPVRALLRARGANGVAEDADDLVATISVIPELREETVRRLRILNAATAKYNADLGGPPTSRFERVRAALLAAGYLNDDPRYAQDAFGNAYLVGEVDAPAIRITSPAFLYTTNDPTGPLPPAPLCP